MAYFYGTQTGHVPYGQIHLAPRSILALVMLTNWPWQHGVSSPTGRDTLHTSSWIFWWPLAFVMLMIIIVWMFVVKTSPRPPIWGRKMFSTWKYVFIYFERHSLKMKRFQGKCDGKFFLEAFITHLANPTGIKVSPKGDFVCCVDSSDTAWQ